MTLKEIRLLLVFKEWTREDLASRLGITRNTIDRWFCVREDHRRHPSPEHVEKMQVWLEDAQGESARKAAKKEKQPA